MDMGGLILFAGVYFMAMASPGPGMAAVIVRGLGQGLAAGPAFIACFVLGDLVWLMLAATGLAVIAHTFEALFIAIKYAGCAYLLFMAWKIWTAPVTAAEAATVKAGPRNWPSFLGSLALTPGNPKAIVFFLSFMPLIVDVKTITPLVFVEMALVIVLVFTPVLTVTLLLAERAPRLHLAKCAAPYQPQHGWRDGWCCGRHCREGMGDLQGAAL